MCKITLWSVEYILKQSTAYFGPISNSIEISLVGRGRIFILSKGWIAKTRKQQMKWRWITTTHLWLYVKCTEWLSVPSICHISMHNHYLSHSDTQFQYPKLNVPRLIPSSLMATKLQYPGTWRRNDMNSLSALLCLCEWSRSMTGGFPWQKVSNAAHSCFLYC